MAKRFTSTEKWDDPWFCELEPMNKLFWVYLLDKCDHAGIWRVNWRLVEFHLGKFVFDKVAFKDRVQILDEEKWFVPKFLEFQYGELNPAIRSHASALAILKKEGVKKVLTTSLQRRLDTDKDTIKDKDTVKEGGAGETKQPGAELMKNDDFKKLWDAWLEVRRAKKVPNTDLALKIALGKLERYGSIKAIAALTNAVEKGWKGIYEPDPQVVQKPGRVLTPEEMQRKNDLYADAKRRRDGY